eukprot:CAMPEP_0119139866 /NCGR_PEP_ID=MMETSP1310-20130426/28271_1 /TAXON_ID=464262 /ORGANISM="Genus nov. species nov., Strain RCC2339" /LENGTH=81 /DNA_ID=CAMNT_0007131191 /DNA_START=26 /DNA_END=267 /DNA_ORIENTATION=+
MAFLGEDCGTVSLSVFAGDVENVTELQKYLEENRERGIDGRDDDERTLLHWCAGVGKQFAVEYLIENGADPTVQDDAGKTG